MGQATPRHHLVVWILRAIVQPPASFPVKIDRVLPVALSIESITSSDSDSTNAITQLDRVLKHECCKAYR